MKLHVASVLTFYTFEFKVPDDGSDGSKHVAVLCSIKVLCMTVYCVCISIIVNTAG